MKTIVVRLALVLLVASQCAAALPLPATDTSETEPESVPLASCIGINIFAPAGWFLRIFQNGSGSLTFGSSPDDSFGIPAGTFAFATIHSELTNAAALQQEGLCFGVGFIHIEKTRALSKRIAYSMTFVRTMFTAVKPALPAERHVEFQMLLDAHPFFPAE